MQKNALPKQREFSLSASGEGFLLLCNGKGMMTPAEKEFVLPTQALGEAIVAEWRAQGEKINPSSMPMMQLASTALDIVPRERVAIVDQVSAYAGTDLLCHRAEQPPELADRQQKVWQPLLEWCARRYDAPLNVGIGLMPVAQPAASLSLLRRVVGGYDNFALAGLRQAVDVSGSLVLGLALAERHLTVQQVFDAAELDHSFQIEKWGEDPASLSRRAGVLRDLDACAVWFDLLRA